MLVKNHLKTVTDHLNTSCTQFFLSHHVNSRHFSCFWNSLWPQRATCECSLFYVKLWQNQYYWKKVMWWEKSCESIWLWVYIVCISIDYFQYILLQRIWNQSLCTFAFCAFVLMDCPSSAFSISCMLNVCDWHEIESFLNNSIRKTTHTRDFISKTDIIIKLWFKV